MLDQIKVKEGHFGSFRINNVRSTRGQLFDHSVKLGSVRVIVVTGRSNILLTGYPVIFFMESFTNLHQFLTLLLANQIAHIYSENNGIVQSESEDLKTFLRHFNITSSAFVNSPIDSKRFSKKSSRWRSDNLRHK